MSIRDQVAAQCIKGFDVCFEETIRGVAGGVVECGCINSTGSSLAANSLGASFALIRDVYPVASWEQGILENIHHRIGRITDGSSHILSSASLWAS